MVRIGKPIEQPEREVIPIVDPVPVPEREEPVKTPEVEIPVKVPA